MVGAKRMKWDLVIGDGFSSPLMGFRNKLKNTIADTRSMRDASRSMMGFGAKATAVGGAMAFGISQFVKPAIEVERQLSVIQSKLGIMDKHDPKIRKIAGTIDYLGEKTEATGLQVAKAASFLAQAGFNAEQVDKSLAGVVNLKLIAGDDVDVGVVGDIASNIGSAFFGKDAANQMNRLSDSLALTTAKSNVDIIQLGETMKMSGSIGKSYGATLEEVLAMGGILGNVGVQGTMAGTGINNFLLGIAGGKNKQIFEDLGIQTRDANGNMRNALDILKELSEATAGMGSGQKLNIVEALFGKIGIKAASPLLAAAGDVKKLHKELLNSEGAADRMVAILGDNTTGAIFKLMSAFSGVRKAVGDLFLEDFKKVFLNIGLFLGSISAWIKDNKETAKTIFKVVGAVSGLLIVVGSLAMALAPVLYTLSFLPILLSPVGLVIAGVVAAVAGLTYMFLNWEDVRSTPFGEFLTGLADMFVTTWKAISWFWDKMKELFSWLDEKIAPMLDAFNFFVSGGKDASYYEGSDGVGSNGAGATDEFGLPSGMGEAVASKTETKETKETKVTIEFNNPPEGVSVKQTGDNLNLGAFPAGM